MPKRERTIALAATLALGLFLVTLLLTHQRQARLERLTGELVTVWQAARPIAAYTPITTEMVKTVQMPRRYLYPGLIAAEETILNRVSLVNVPGEALLTSTHLLEPESAESDLVKVTLSKGVLMDSGLVPGDVVMVVASFRDGTEDVSRILLEAARLAAINTHDREPSVALWIPVARLEELIRIHDYGKAIHLTRRPLQGG